MILSAADLVEADLVDDDAAAPPDAAEADAPAAASPLPSPVVVAPAPIAVVPALATPAAAAPQPGLLPSIEDEAAAFRVAVPKRGLVRAGIALALLSAGFAMGRLTAPGLTAAAVSSTTARPLAEEIAPARAAPNAPNVETPASIPAAMTTASAVAPPEAVAAPAPVPMEVAVAPAAVSPPRRPPARTGGNGPSAPSAVQGVGRAPGDAKQGALELPASPPPPVDVIVQAVQEGMREKERSGQ